jgi:amino acid adenylation domain-containing protein
MTTASDLSDKRRLLLEKLLQKQGLAPAVQRIPRRAAGGPAPLSFAQQRLWFLDRLKPGSNWYNVPAALRLEGPLEVPALRRSLAVIVHRHDALRTTFPEMDGQPEQRIAADPPDLMEVIDLSAVPDHARAAEMQSRLARVLARPFDLAAGPLFRVTLLRLAVEDHVLALVAHHIVSDAWSTGVFVRELSALYGQILGGEAPLLPELPIQYADFAVWQRQWLTGETLERLVERWRSRLAGAPTALELSTDRPHPPVQTFRGGAVSFHLDETASSAFRGIYNGAGVTPFMAFLAAFQALLHRYSGQADVLVGSPIAGRHREELEGLIGVFINTLVLRGDLSAAPTFRELVSQARERVLEAYSMEDLPFEKLVEELNPMRDPARSPLFQVMFVLQNAPVGALSLPGLTLRPVRMEGGVAKFELVLSLSESGGMVSGTLQYNSDLFDHTTAMRMAGHLETLVAAAACDPDQLVAELPLLSEPEYGQLLLEWNDTEKPCPQVPLVHELFAAHARRQPEATAVAAADGSCLTYGELEARSNRLAWHLRALGVGPEVLVAICADRTPARVVGIVGALKAGGAYVSLDPGYPKDRLAYLLEDAGAPVLLTEERFLPALPETRARVILLDGAWEGDESRAPESGVTPDNLSYVVYTSGSTGRPKGVQIPHAGLMNLVRWHQDLYGVAPGERGTQIASPAFDASIWELWPYLAGGASLHIPDEETRLSSSGMIRWWSEQGITLAYLMTPLAEGVLEEEIPEGLNLKVRALIIGGDRLHRRPRPEVGFRLMNHYGPAEYTVTSTVVQVPPEGQGGAIPTIGRAVDNTRIYVLDQRQHPVPVGVPGELYVAGVGLARGYHERPDLTAEKFVPDPFSEEPGARMYRTADLVRYLPDGDMDFLGRLDHQVKIRGLRIELGEIESVLGQHPEVREAAVLVREDRPGDKRLTAYVVGSAGVEDLRAFLRERLPEYMIPAAFLLLDSLPLTSNGKVDRRALPAPEWQPEAYVAPRNPVEAVLAAIWSKVLKVDKVGVHDNFFDLGGHSLLMTQVTSRVRRTFRVEVPLRAYFESPTVERLAEVVVAHEAKPGQSDKIARALQMVKSMSAQQVKDELQVRQSEG